MGLAPQGKAGNPGRAQSPGCCCWTSSESEAEQRQSRAKLSSLGLSGQA